MREGWEYKKLGEVCKVIMGQSPDGNSVNSSNGIEFHQGKVFFGEKYLNVSNSFTEQPSKIAEPNSVLLCVRAPVGIVNISQRRICIGRGLCSIQPNDIMTMPFLFYALTQKQAYFDKNSTGSTFKAISTKVVINTEIPIPPLSEQQRIVEELDLLGSVIEKKKEQLEELDNLAQSIFYDMFGDPIENPKGWVKYALSKICDVRDGTHDSPKYVEQGYPLITSKNVVNGILSFDNVGFISEKDLIKINQRSKVDDGDIIMPMIGTIGKPIIVHKTREFAIKNVALFKFANSKLVLNIYVRELFSCSVYDDFLRGQNRGGTQKFISLKNIRELPIPLPPLSLQQQFASKIEAIEQQKELIKQSIKEVETLFNSRMDYYFN